MSGHAVFCPLCRQPRRGCFCDPQHPGKPPVPRPGQWKRPGATYAIPGEEAAAPEDTPR